MKPWIATEKILLDGVLAHDVGHEVPDENVTRYGWHDLVSRDGTKAAAAAITDPPNK